MPCGPCTTGSSAARLCLLRDAVCVGGVRLTSLRHAYSIVKPPLVETRKEASLGSLQCTEENVNHDIPSDSLAAPSLSPTGTAGLGAFGTGNAAVFAKEIDCVDADACQGVQRKIRGIGDGDKQIIDGGEKRTRAKTIAFTEDERQDRDARFIPGHRARGSWNCVHYGPLPVRIFSLRVELLSLSFPYEGRPKRRY